MGADIKSISFAAACLTLVVGWVSAEQVIVPREAAVPEDWPAGWAATYRRFEGFLATKKRFWPAAGLLLVDEVGVVHSVPLPDAENGNVALEIRANGGCVLNKATKAPQATDLGTLEPGLYSVCAESSGRLGYQYHFPLLWVESIPSSGPQGRFQEPKRRLRIVPAPGDGMAIWPNERLLGYLDFHIFSGHRYRDEIRKTNQAVLPAVHLGIDNHGVVERDLLTDRKAEELLHWRIYHDGRLVESGRANGIGRREMTHGPGNYLVLIGAEGPAGFLPVSNFLEFPLFPDREGKPQVFPRDTDSNGTPDFIETMIASGKAGFGDIPADQDSDNDGLTDIEEAGPQVIAPAGSTMDDERRVLQLWRQWDYELKNRHPWW